MSEDNSQEPQEAANKTNRPIIMALLAGLLGLAVGAGLYAFSDQIATGDSQGSGPLASRSCPVDQTLRANLDKAAGGHVAAFQPADRGFSVAELAFRDETGTMRRLADWRGKTVLFNLWATWCAPCRAEMPALDALQRDLGGDAFEVVLVSVDLGTPAKPKKFYNDIGMQHAGFFHDGDLNTLNLLKKSGLAFGLPATLLIDGEGCVLGTLNGPAEWASDDAKKLVQTAF